MATLREKLKLRLYMATDPEWYVIFAWVSLLVIFGVLCTGKVSL